MAANRNRSKQEVLDALTDVVQVSSTLQNKSNFPESYSSTSFSGQSPMNTSEGLPSLPTKDRYNPLSSIAQGTTTTNTTPTSNGRNRQKEQPAPPPVAKSNMGKFSNAFKRQTTEEKEAKRREKEKRMNKAIDESTIKSSRMDIIDRLDLSGIHGSSLFHHDSPYDACSPHSNRNTRKAPVNAFDHTIDPMTGQSIGLRSSNGSRPGLSPLAAATMRKMDENVGDLDGETKRGVGKSNLSYSSSRSQTMPSGTIPTLRMDSNSTAATYMDANGDEYDESNVLDRDVDAERSYRTNAYFNTPNNVSKGKSDVTVPNADIWGVSSEPWQDFAQPAAPVDSGGLRPGKGRGGHRLSVDSGGSGTASAASSVFDMEAVMTGRKPSTRPKNSNVNNDRSVSEGAPKRSKSLIKKIKSARQNPNVPASQDDTLELGNLSLSNSNDSRPRASSGASPQQSSSGANRKHHHGHSPSSPPLTQRNVSSPGNLTTRASLGRKEGSDGFYYRDNNSGPISPPLNATGLSRNGSIFNRLRGKNRERGEVAAR